MEEKGDKTHSQRIIEPQPAIQLSNSPNLVLLQIPPGNLQVLLQPLRVITLRNNRHTPLRGPPQQHLRRCASMLLRNALNKLMLKQRRRIHRILHAQLKETQRSKRTIRRNGQPLLLGILDQPGLREVGVMLDLQRGRTNARIPQQIHDQLCRKVTNTDAASELLVHERLHRRPGLLDRGVAELQLIVLRHPARRVADRRVDVFQRDGEVHDVQVEVVDAPVGELLAADGFYAVAVVEAVPELGDNEELFTLDETIFDGPRDALAGFNFVSVVYVSCVSLEILVVFYGGSSTAGAVKQTVSFLDGLVDLVSAGVVVHLPETEAHEGHVVAAV